MNAAFSAWGRARAVLVIVGGASVLSLAAQDAPPRPSFQNRVDIVQLDVSVVDKKTRLPVRGLTAADFTLTDSGKPQPISAFSAVELPDRDMTLAPWTRTVGPDAVSNRLNADRTVLIVMDDFHVVQESIGPARRIGNTAVDLLGPSDIAAVVYLINRRKGQEFTTDHGRLHAAVDRFDSNEFFTHMGFPMGSTGMCQQNDCATQAFQNAARSVLEMPAGRKALIYVTGKGSVPYNFISDALEHPEMVSDLRQTFDMLRRANVNVYSFDAGGITLSGFLDERFSMFSANTGGWSVSNTNAPWEHVAAVFRENNSYYILGFNSTAEKADGRFHKVEVHVNRPDVEIHARSGYYAPTKAPAKPPKTAALPALDRAVAGALPVREIPMRLFVAPIASAGQTVPTVAVLVGLDRTAAITDAKVTMLATAYRDDWKNRGVNTQVLDLGRATSTKDGRYELAAKLPLEPGRYEVRVAVTGSESQRTGSAYGSVVVPDFTKEPLSLSGVFLERPAVSSTSRTVLNTLLPLQPTTTRDFVRLEPLTAFVRVFQGGKAPVVPIQMTVQVTDTGGEVVATARHDLPSELFVRRAADYLHDVPLELLNPGRYLLSIEATDGKHVQRREVPFSVVE